MPSDLDRLQRTGELLNAVVGALDDVVFVLDASCRYYGIWGRWLERRDLDAADFIGKTCAEVWGDEESHLFAEVNQQVLGGETVVFERWFTMPWGPVFYQSTLSPLRGAGDEIIGICGIRRDITELKHAEDAVRREKDYARHIIESANVMVVGLDVNGTVRLFNQAAEQLTGWNRSHVVGQDWFETIVPRERYPHAWQAFQTHYVHSGDDTRARTYRRYSEGQILTLSGEERTIAWMDSEVPDADRQVDLVSFGIDITDSRRHEQQLEHLATHDPLTDLPNRRSFETALGRAVARARRGTTSAVLFIDVDDFKLCNDTHGHTFGDAILTEIARVLYRQVREPDLVARLGGDEFAALLEGASVGDACLVAERMREAVVQMAEHQGTRLDLSIGVMSMDGDADYESVLSGADTAMYASKRAGSGVVVYEPEST